MSEYQPTRPRITVDVDPELYARIKKVLPWGSTSRVIATILEDVITAIETHGDRVLAALLAKSIKLEHVSNKFNESNPEE